MRVYTYKKQRVFLEYESEMSGVEPLESDGMVGCYPVEAYNGSSTCCTIDEDYIGDDKEGEEEIVYGTCMNVENEQCLTDGWYTKHYEEVDEYRRELCVKTTRFHMWSSELAILIDQMWSEANNGKLTKFMADQMRKSWENTVEHCRGKITAGNPFDLPEVPTFDSILESEGLTVELSEIDN